jgi:hypothetical protein
MTPNTQRLMPNGNDVPATANELRGTMSTFLAGLMVGSAAADLERDLGALRDGLRTMTQPLRDLRRALGMPDL